MQARPAAPSSRLLPVMLAALWPVSASAVTSAEQVDCHVTYGGETQTISAPATTDPYTVKPVAIGSYFLFRLVFQRAPSPLPAIKLHTYADQDGGPVPIHIGEFPYPPGRRQVEPGFTGHQTVYEPVRDGQLQYWCALRRSGR